MLVGSATILGVFASFVTVQNQLRLGIPWLVISLDVGRGCGSEMGEAWKLGREGGGNDWVMKCIASAAYSWSPVSFTKAAHPSQCPSSEIHILRKSSSKVANTQHRYFPYWITSASLSLLFILIMLWLISQRQLLPGIVIMGSFILFVLWMVGLIVVSIELWGPTGSVNGNCNLYVSGRQSTGASIETLAWLEQHSICKCPLREVLWINTDS